MLGRSKNETGGDEVIKKLMKDKVAISCIAILLVISVMGIFSAQFALHDPNAQNIINKFAASSLEYPLGTDALGRCVYSRLVYGIRPTIFLAFFTMLCTIAIGTIVGLVAGYSEGLVDEILMRFCDIMLSFPSQVMILAIVGILGVGIENVVFANILIKWTWYARMIRGRVISFRHKNYMLYAKAIGTPKSYVIFKHLLPNIMAELIILATLDMGWVILNISTLSFLGLGVQAPTAEWGAMLSEAKNVLSTHPEQMLAPGLAILIVVAVFNLLGDSLSEVFNVKEKN